MTHSLDLALIGNCTVGALIDARGEMAWACVPRFDGDAAFCALLRPRGEPGGKTISATSRSSSPISSAPNSITSTTPPCSSRACTTATAAASR